MMTSYDSAVAAKKESFMGIVMMPLLFLLLIGSLPTSFGQLTVR
jgi:hypothetical protein